MSKAHSPQKGHSVKHQDSADAFPSQSSREKASSLDSNQSNQAMNDSDTGNRSVEGATAADVEGSSDEFGKPQDLEDGRSYRHLSGSESKPKAREDSEGGIMAKAASLIDSQAVKKNLNLVKNKAQDLIATGREQVSGKLGSITDDVKLRGMMVDESVKANPYAYALGAVGLGFILGRAFSGKGKGDLDALVATINKINLGSVGAMLGMKAETGSEQPDYNSDQARKIG